MGLRVLDMEFRVWGFGFRVRYGDIRQVDQTLWLFRSTSALVEERAFLRVKGPGFGVDRLRI